MKPLFSEEEFRKAKTKEKLPCECEQCGNKFYTIKHEIQRVFHKTRLNVAKYCSKDCSGIANTKRKEVQCKNCNKKFIKRLDQILKSKNNNFCSKSCSATFNNKNKTYGTRRSKLEVFIENKLKEDYSQIQFLSNDKTTISSELDFYFPKYKIAIELNGITHYKPIFGQRKLEMIIKNDKEKQKLCNQNGITLYVINTSELSHNCEKNFIPYYMQVVEKIKATPN